MALCKCGCGEETKTRTITNARYGWKKGEPNEYIRGHNRPWSGKSRPPFSAEYIEKQRIAQTGKKRNMSERGKEVLRKNMAIATSPENRLKTTMKLRGRKLTPEHVRNAMRRRGITNLELAFQKIINDHSLPYKYVGDGSFVIDGLNPDFVNTNGEKIAIEVYARMYKNIGDRTVETYKREREERLSVYGWKVLFFDETQVRPDVVISALGGHSD